ncbi:MAG: AAA family ATPase [Promethearchaeota archaeon]
MKKSIAFSGKGGVGKTTILILFLKYLIEKNENKRILVIDADPDANIADRLGINLDFYDTIAGKMQLLMYKINRETIAPYASNRQAIEAEILPSIIHMKDFDLLEMGRSEGIGCYCSVNNVLKNTIDLISEDYNYILFDSPAGLEHFARKTGKDVTDLLIVVGPSKMALHTLERILIVSKDVSLKFNNYWVLGNKYSENNKDFLVQKLKEIEEPQIKLLGFIPQDNELMKYNFLNDNLLKISNENGAYKEIKKIFSIII